MPALPPRAPLTHAVLTCGMKPACSTPSSPRQKSSDSRPLSQNCAVAATDHSTIWPGTHRSGPIHLHSSCDGISAHMKATLNTVLA